MRVYQEPIVYKKRDQKGRIYRELRCPGVKDDGSVCRAFLLDEYIRLGRIRVTCFRCGKIWILEFSPTRSSGENIRKVTSKKE